MIKKYLYIGFCLSLSFLYSRSMELTSAKTYARVEKNLPKAEEFGLKALEIEPDNSYIAYFMGKEVFRPQKKRVQAGQMFVEALNRKNTRLERPFRIGKNWIETVHDAVKLYGGDWFNYGVESFEKGQFDDAIAHFTTASKLDPSLTGTCYSSIAEILYVNKKDVEKALEFIDVALNESKDEVIILELKIKKATYLRKNNKNEEAFKILSNIPEASLSLNAEYELFLIHMDSDNCDDAINIGDSLFVRMENDPKISMAVLSELAFNIAACYKHKGELLYNEIIDYLGEKEKSNESTQLFLDKGEKSKEYYSSAKDYFRLSLDYDENPAETTKTYKKEMRKNMRKIDDQITPTLESLLK